jgi:hypothetical protein
MIGLVNTLAALEPQPLSPKLQLIESTEYLINTDNIISLKVESTDDSLIEYTLNKHDDRLLPFELKVSQTNAAIQALSDVTKNSETVALNLFLNSLNFADIANDTAVATFVNADQIVWGEDDSTGAYCRLILETGGFDLSVVFVDYTIAEVLSIVDTGS